MSLENGGEDDPRIYNWTQEIETCLGVVNSDVTLPFMKRFFLRTSSTLFLKFCTLPSLLWQQEGIKTGCEQLKVLPQRVRSPYTGFWYTLRSTRFIVGCPMTFLSWRRGPLFTGLKVWIKRRQSLGYNVVLWWIRNPPKQMAFYSTDQVTRIHLNSHCDMSAKRINLRVYKWIIYVSGNSEAVFSAGRVNALWGCPEERCEPRPRPRPARCLRQSPGRPIFSRS